VLSPVLFNVFLQAIIDEVTRQLELAGITGGVTRVRYDGKELKWPPASSRSGRPVTRGGGSGGSYEPPHAITRSTL